MHLFSLVIENVLFEFCDYTKLNLVGGEQNLIEIRLTPQRSPTVFLHLQHVKKRSAFSFKLNLVLKVVAVSFSEINPVTAGSF